MGPDVGVRVMDIEKPYEVAVAADDVWRLRDQRSVKVMRVRKDEAVGFVGHRESAVPPPPKGCYKRLRARWRHLVESDVVVLVLQIERDRNRKDGLRNGGDCPTARKLGAVGLAVGREGEVGRCG